MSSFLAHLRAVNPFGAACVRLCLFWFANFLSLCHGFQIEVLQAALFLEKSGKHFCMKNDSLKRPNPLECVGIPTHNGNRATSLLNLIGSAMLESHGRRLTYAEMAAYAGLSTSALFEWMAGSPLRQLEAVIRMLEQLPDAKRCELIRRVCGVLPTIHHPRINWRESQTSMLSKLLEVRSGLCLIEGDEEAVGFLANALGHTSARFGSQSRVTCGIDIRIAYRFVPVQGVFYLNQPLSKDLRSELVHKIWPTVQKARDCVVLMIGIWPEMTPEILREVVLLTKQAHVIIADQANHSSLYQNGQAKRLPAECHSMTVKLQANRNIELNLSLVQAQVLKRSGVLEMA